MPPWIKKLSLLLTGLIALGVFAVWLLLSSSLLANMRGDLSARYLSGKLGQSVQITDGVRVRLGSRLQVSAQGLVLPSPAMGDINLAEITRLEFAVALGDLLRGRINPSDILLEGARVELVIDAQENMSWSTPAATPSSDPGASDPRANDPNGAIAALLAGQGVRFANSGVTYRDSRNGLELELDLSALELRQKDRSSPVVLRGDGSLNGQDLTLSGTFPQDQPFRVNADFSQIAVQLDGAPDPAGYVAGFSTAIDAEIAELGQLLDVLKLERSLSGTGQINAVLAVSPDGTSISDLDVSATLAGGQSLELTGDLGQLDDPYDVTLDTRIRLFSPANMPPPTDTRRDLQLTGIDMLLEARPGQEPLRRMVVATNGFVLDTGGVGLPPISLSQISRTPQGLLRVGRLVVRIGPTDAPFLILDGPVEDALRLEGIDLEATLALSIAGLIAPVLLRESEILGRISGGFRLRGSGTRLGIFDLNVASEGTDLWRLNVAGSVGNALTLSDVTLGIGAEIPSVAAVLKTLDLQPVEAGPVTLETTLTSQGAKWQMAANILIAQSQLAISTDLDLDEANPVVRGLIESDLIRVEHLRDFAIAVLQMQKLGDQEKEAAQQARNAATPATAAEEGQPDSQPAQADGATQANGPVRDVTLKPLGQAILLSGVDLGVTVDFRKIEGEKGITSLKSDLELKDQKARLGPVKFEYGGASFDLSGSLDLENKPGIVTLSGSAGGWNFGNIMRELQFRKTASGTLWANFNLSGEHASISDFLATMTGRATVSMRNGSIDTQLLNLAGLGVVPWIFSKKPQAAVTIVCIRAPLQISKGRVSSEQAVVETSQVQIVLYGNVDLRRQTMDINGQPRRIGKPLSRSPWPFTAVGPIAKPNVTLKDGPRRLRRTDGASSMPERRKICIPDILQLK